MILREVLGFSAREVAESLETTVASVNSALQRARKSVDERLPARSQQATLRSLGDERTREIVEAYVEAWSRGDVKAVGALLAKDAIFSMPPWSSWWRGRETIAGFAKEAAEARPALPIWPPDSFKECPRQESNLRTRFRKPVDIVGGIGSQRRGDGAG